MNKKVIIFDFDGTIADTPKAIIRITKPLLKKFGFKNLKQENMRTFKNKKIQEITKELNIPLIKLPIFITKIQAELNKKIDEVKPISGIKPVLTELKKAGYSIGILTSNTRNNVKKFLRVHNLDFFDFISSEKNLFGKSRKIKNILKNQHLKSKELVYIGDETRDIEAARKNKIPVIAVTWGFNSKKILKKMKPDFLIDKPEKLLKILKEAT